MCIAGESYNGPDFFFCYVTATEEEIEKGDHYKAAKNFIADLYDIEPNFVCDEDDPCKAIMDLFVWESIKDEDPIYASEWK